MSKLSLALLILAMLGSLVIIIVPPSATEAASIVADGTTCTLADAIQSANTDTSVGGCSAGSGADTITLDANVSLTIAEGTATTILGGKAGLPDITSDITIQAGAGNTIAGNNTNFRILTVMSNTLTLQGIAVQGGQLVGNGVGGGGIYVNGSANLILQQSSVTFNNINYLGGGGASSGGGGIYNLGSVSLTGSSVSNNNVTGADISYVWGGGIYSEGPTSLISSQVNNNTMSAENMAGAGIFLPTGSLTVSQSTIKNNVNSGPGSARGYGGGIMFSATGGTIIITDSTISNNSSTLYSGLAIGSVGAGSIIRNSTISNNISTSDGGGIYFGGSNTLIIQNTTIAFNQSGGNSGGITNEVGGSVELYSSIVANNSPQDCWGTLASQDYNLVESPGVCPLAGSHDLTGIDPALAALANNGGPTFTNALLVGSPATDKGSCGLSGISFDQRGVSRPFDDPGLTNADDGCDIGAYETTQLSPTPTPTPTACIVSTTPPNLISPAHRTHTTATTPTFTWSTVNGAQSYRLMIYLEDRSFEYKRRFVGQTNTTYTLQAGEALSPAKYLWRVRTQDITCGTWTLWSGRNTLFIN